MKKQITLSLITAAILGLNGCGETSTGVSEESIKLSSIKQLSKTSTKHTESDWIELENNIQALDNTEGFNTMLLDSIEKNIATLTYVGVDKEMAYATNSDAMFDDLRDLDIEDLDSQVLAECKEADETCKEMAYASLDTSVLIDKEMAYAIATDIRKDEGKPTTMDGLLEKFTCEAGLVRKVQFYGVEDNFSTANGDEVAYPSTQVINNAGIQAYPGTGLSNYDFSTQNTLFAEEVKNLPSSIANGHFYIGMKNNGSNDGITLGNLDENISTEDVFSGTISSNNAGLSKSAQVYHSQLSDIDLVDGSTLKQYAYNNQGFDVYVQDDTFVDFIAVATCSKPNPIKDVTTIIDKFECSEKETMVKIMGGEIDNFAPGQDTATPSTTLTNVNSYPKTSYDATSYDRHFIDTLNLGLSSSQTVSKAEFNIGYKVIGSALYSNDAMYVGEMNVNHAGGHFYDNVSPIIPQGWSVNNISGYGNLAQIDLEELNNTVGTGTVFDTMVNNGFLDVYVQDDTSVDFTQLNLCVKDNCSEDAEDFSIDLSQLASWSTQATDVIENNPIPSVWDDTLNWFEFTSKETNGNRVLNIPFCACSDTIVRINSLKADNSAIIKLDNNTTIATQQASGQAAMRADNNGGIHADGSLTLPANQSGPTNHVLSIDVQNQSSYFGVGVEGILNFRGTLGKCD